MTKGPGLARTPLPKGFKAGGINSGVRKYRPDLGLLLSETDATCVAVYTKNECKAAPIQYCQSLLPSKHIRAIVTNSGQANAATGEEGRQNNFRMASAFSRSIGCLPHQVVTASTGVIGKQMEIEKIETASPELMNQLNDYSESFSLAILTTDLTPKAVSLDVSLTKGTVKITGIAKGSGMIHPNMATMLGYLITDCALTTDVAQTLLSQVTQDSFNMISVDGDSSTNDCVFLMANGASGVGLEADSDWTAFKQGLLAVSQELAKAIARDGEGAQKLLEVTLEGLSDEALARKAARGITLSPLIKTAMHGEDPNWGRILARLGAEGVKESDLDQMFLSLENTPVFENGRPVAFDVLELRKKLKADTIHIQAKFNNKTINRVTAWGCDLTKRYVEINIDYN